MNVRNPPWPDSRPHGDEPTGSGLQMFVRYAYPPNLRGYCGPADASELREYGVSGAVDPGLVELAKAFTGPWPYLTLMAESAGIPDPFDIRVVEAYWIGNSLLDRVDMSAFGDRVEASFRGRAGHGWGYLAEAIPAGGRPHHGFHVFGVYPWVGLLTETDRGEPLEILDRCRIRWGQVVAAGGDSVMVRSRSLTWDGRRLGLGAPEVETVRQSVDGAGFIDPVEPGDVVSLHWDWVCERLSPSRLRRLRSETARQLELTNTRLAHPGPHMVIG